jgi:hypothetical protein
MVSDLYNRLRRSRREGAVPVEAAEESMFEFFFWKRGGFPTNGEEEE